MSTQTDVILLKYQMDLGEVEAKSGVLKGTLMNVEETGEKAFNSIANAAQGATPKIANVGKAVEKTKTQFNQLGNSINQISRELPAFAVNMNTGFLAISNNLPALFDTIKALNDQNKALQAEGKATQSVLKQVAGAIFSVQTALSIAVTLLTVYGGKIIGFITGQKDSAEATKDAEAALKKYNDQLKIQRILQQTWDADTKNQIAALDKQTSSQQKAVNQQDLILKQKQEIAALNEKEEQSIQDLFKTYEIDYLEYLKLLQAESDPALRAALGETRMADLRQRVHITQQMNDQLRDIQNAYQEERKSLEQKQRKEFSDLLVNENRKISTDQISELKRRLQIEEAAGRETYSLQLEIFAREIALLDSVTEEYKDKIAERDAFIAKKENESADKRKELIDKSKEYFLKQQEDTRQQAGEEIQRMTDEYLAQKEREKKADEEAAKQRRELLGEDVRDYYKSNEKKKAALDQELSFSQTTYERRREILKEQLDKDYITQYEYADSIKQLEDAKRMAALNTISAVGDALGAFSQLVGQNTEAGKALAIAQTTIDTYVAAQKAYLSQLQFEPSAPIRATIAAAAAVASGLARVATIAAVNVPKPSAQKGAISTGQSAGFKDGVVDLNGPGTGTSDSIPAWLSRGESVITARSTSAKRDELVALNKSIPDYEMLLYKKYVKPAIDAEQEKQNQFAANVARSIMMQGAFNDARIVKAIEKNRPATGKDIAKLADNIAKQNRIAKFESNLKQPK